MVNAVDQERIISTLSRNTAFTLNPVGEFAPTLTHFRCPGGIQMMTPTQSLRPVRTPAVSAGASAKSIGRVGLLAVALGIGVSVGGNAGVAWADETTSNVSTRPTATKGGGSSSAREGRPRDTQTPQSALPRRANPSRATQQISADALPHPAAAEPARPRRSSVSEPGPMMRTPEPTLPSQSAIVPDTASAGAQTGIRLPQPAHAASPHSVGTWLASRVPAADVTANGTTTQARSINLPPALRDAIEGLKVCACKTVVNVFGAIANLLGTADVGEAPTPVDNPLVAAAAAWVRRVTDQIKNIPVIGPAVVAAEEELKRIYQVVVDRLTITSQELIKCAYPTEEVRLPADLDRVPVASGLDQPTDFRFLPDGRILIVEKAGAVKIVRNADPVSTPVTIGVIAVAADRELGAVELDPDFAENGHIYVAYATKDYHDRLSRFTIVDDTLDLSSELVLLDEAGSGPMHHGNTVLFGSDGKLYWAFGDNGLNSNGQNLSTVYGKILRLNPDGTIPEDNPFYNTPDARKEIYAYGLRNPFRMTFAPNGSLLVGDVGDRTWEELNNVVAGGNYGWPSAEGACADCGYANPIYTYPHTPPPSRAGSITTVTVYTGTALPERYQNKVFISDYTLRWTKMLTLDPTYSNVLEEEMLDTEAGTTVQLLEGPDGNLYQLNIYPGTLYRISASGGNRAPTAVLTATPTQGYAPLTVEFSSAGSGDPDPDTTLTYNWDFGDGATSTTANPTRTYNADGTYMVTLVVSDGSKTGSATQKIVVGSTAPEVQILTPVSESKYNAGDVISFSATATDAEDGSLPDSAYEWTVIFHHADHIHPYQDNIIGPTGTITLSTNDHNVDTTWYRFTVTVTDTSGLSTTRSTNIRPNLVTLRFDSNQPGATYTIDGIPRTGVYTEQAVVGVVRVLDAPSPQTVNGAELTFNNWSDGGAQQHQISTPATDTTYTVTFDVVNSAV
jgi:glucose/arabinose dehydrogenase